ncbi:hypothetical protein [Methylovulum psychrotolerans]|uniref:hypothetical protein n=1 Tax=Methylovulum psychrotolerans TaxID=1704499 RepID=UPI0012F92AF3|nr:hypothetical protein [Methylovulum psychrotolerans]
MLTNNLNKKIDNQQSFVPWSLLNADVSDIVESINAVSDATGTTTHVLDVPKDLHSDDS